MNRIEVLDITEGRALPAEYCRQEDRALERLRVDCGIDRPYVPDVFGPLFATRLIEACAKVPMITNGPDPAVTPHREELAEWGRLEGGGLEIKAALRHLKVDEYIAFTLAGYGLQRQRRADLWNVLQLAIQLKREATMIESTRLLRDTPERTEYDPALSFYSSLAVRDNTEEAKPRKEQVAGLMDSLLERPKGSTWSELSEKAQALADKLGHKTKYTIGEVKSHARFRHRQTTGRWANLRLEEFEDRSGGRLVDKSRRKQ